MASGRATWTDELVTRLLALKNQGNSNIDIAEQLGFSEEQVASKFYNMSQYTQVGVESNEPEHMHSLFALYQWLKLFTA